MTAMIKSICGNFGGSIWQCITGEKSNIVTTAPKWSKLNRKIEKVIIRQSES